MWFSRLYRLHKRWVTTTNNIGSQRTVPYFHSVGDERRPLGMHWAHSGLQNAKSGWEASSWLVFIAGLRSLSLQIMNIRQVRLVRNCEMFVCRSDSALIKTWPCPWQFKLCPCPAAFLLSPSVALSSPPEVLSHLLHGTIILGKWYPHLDICFPCSWGWEISPKFTDDQAPRKFPLEVELALEVSFSPYFIVGQFGPASC